MKKTYLEIANEIKNFKVLNARILDANDNISRMILITDFIIDFDEYYINKDTEPNDQLWVNVYNELNRQDKKYL